MKCLTHTGALRAKTVITAAAMAVTAGLAGAPAHAQTDFEEAHSLRSLDIMLMVTALRCRSGPHDFQADYNRFAAAHLPHLNAAGRTLRHNFAASYGQTNPERALDRMGVRIANSYGDGHPWMECAELQQMTRELVQQSDRAKLAETARYMLRAARPEPALPVAQGVTASAATIPTATVPATTAPVATTSAPTTASPQRVPARIGYTMRADWTAGPR